MKYVFGKSIDFRFTPMADDEEQTLYSLVSARIYSAEPTDAQIENTTTGHIEEVATATLVSGADGGPAEWSIVFSALTDSDPHDSDEFEKYYVVVNFKLQSGGTTVYVDEQISVYRPNGITSKVRVKPSDMCSLESKLEDLYTTKQLQDKLSLGRKQVFRKLEGLGKPRKWLFDAEDLNDAVLYLSVSLACADLAGEGNQFWLDKSKYYERMFETIFSQTRLDYSFSKDRRFEEEMKLSPGAGAIYVQR